MGPTARQIQNQAEDHQRSALQNDFIRPFRTVSMWVQVSGVETPGLHHSVASRHESAVAKTAVKQEQGGMMP
jgi:hypothetical protein